MEAPTGAKTYFDLDGYAHKELFADCEHVWEVLPKLPTYIDAHLRPGPHGVVMEGAWVGPRVYLGPGSVVEPGAMIKGPAIIGSNTVIRQGAYLRENCLIGDNCVIGHASEVKASIMLDGSQAPHFNYVGDSIVGRQVNLGAGVKLSNVKNAGGVIRVVLGEQSGLRAYINSGCHRRSVGAGLQLRHQPGQSHRS